MKDRWAEALVLMLVAGAFVCLALGDYSRCRERNFSLTECFFGPSARLNID